MNEKKNMLPSKMQQKAAEMWIDPKKSMQPSETATKARWPKLPKKARTP